MGNAKCGSTGAAEAWARRLSAFVARVGHRGGGAWQVKFRKGGRFWKCSLMSAYVRLCSLNGRKNVEKSSGECPEATEATEVTEDAGIGEKDGACEHARPPTLGNLQIAGAARGHCGLQNARNDEPAKAMRSDRRSSQIGPIKA